MIVATQSNRPQDVFYVHWNLGKRCNFDCSYCADSLHDFISKHKSLDDLIKIAEKLKNNVHHKKIRIWFTGGEPTVNPNFLEFCKYLHNDGRFILGLNTNGSRTSEYFLKLIEYVDVIQFSTHFEFIDEVKFLEMISIVNAQSKLMNKTINVNLMMEPEYWNTAVKFVKYCESNNIEYHIKRIRNKDNFTSDDRRYTPVYTDDQLKFIIDKEYRNTYLEEFDE